MTHVKFVEKQLTTIEKMKAKYESSKNLDKKMRLADELIGYMRATTELQKHMESKKDIVTGKIKGD
jgi:hypothetical protein